MGRAVQAIVRESRRIAETDDLDSVILFVTSTCNLRCGFCCYAEHLNTSDDIPLADLLTISRTAPRFRALLISGGEPFLRRDLPEIMSAFVANNGVESISIPTNGWYGDRSVEATRAFVTANPDTVLSVTFSVDGFAPLHDRVRGRPGTFDRLCRTIRLMEPLREISRNLRLRVNTVVTSENIDEVRALIDWFHATFDVLDEHALEVVRDLTAVGADHESTERRQLADRYVDLVGHSNCRYAGREGQRGQLTGVPDAAANIIGAAHALAAAGVKRDRILGRLWGFPCTAGRKIVVIDGEGSLKACEHRGTVVDLRAHGFDVTSALAADAMRAERRAIAGDGCDCIHGCFVGNSLKHSPRAVLRHEIPAAVRVMTRR